MRRQVVTWRGSLRGLSVGLLGGMMESMASSRVSPEALPSFLSTFHPWMGRVRFEWNQIEGLVQGVPLKSTPLKLSKSPALYEI